jgi:CRP-like cAMP-binding protein
MATDANVEHLAHVRLFSNLNARELRLLGKASNERHVPSGRVLAHEGTSARELTIVLEGQAVVRRGGRRVAMVGPGQYFGELSLVDRAPRDTTIVADSAMTILVLGQREFSAVVDTVPALSHKLLQAMAHRLREADAKAISH